MGQRLELKNGGIYVKRNRRIAPTNITTLPFPGFPTDLQAQFMVLLSQGQGISTVTEKVYPDRFMHVPELNRMGAKNLVEAQKGLLYAGVLKILVPLIIVLPGVIGFYYFGD